MNARDVVREAGDRGVTLRRDGDSIRIRGPRAAVEEFRPQIAAVKADLMALLAEVDIPAADVHAYVVVRAIEITVDQFGVCVSCGVPWELHGRPPVDAWAIVDEPGVAPLIRARALVAAEIAERVALSPGGRLCTRCHRIGRVYGDGVCTFCADDRAGAP